MARMSERHHHVVTVMAFVPDGSGRVLLVRPHGRGWEMPGGRVEPGEDVVQAAVREVAEELGLLISPGALQAIDRCLVSLAGETELTSLFRLEHPGPFSLEPPEVAGLALHPQGTRPSPLSPACAELCRRLDAGHPGWDRPAGTVLSFSRP